MIGALDGPSGMGNKDATVKGLERFLPVFNLIAAQYRQDGQQDRAREVTACSIRNLDGDLGRYGIKRDPQSGEYLTASGKTVPLPSGVGGRESMVDLGKAGLNKERDAILAQISRIDEEVRSANELNDQMAKLAEKYGSQGNSESVAEHIQLRAGELSKRIDTARAGGQKKGGLFSRLMGRASEPEDPKDLDAQLSEVQDDRINLDRIVRELKKYDLPRLNQERGELEAKRKAIEDRLQTA